MGSNVRFKSTGLGLGQKLRALERDGKTIARVALASRVRDLIEEGFIRETDPTFHKWAPRKDSKPHPILTKSGAMRRGFEIDLRGALIVTSNVVSDKGRPYPLFHQKGTKKMVARRVLPVRGLPSHWRADFDRTTRAALERLGK
jgi:phage gpG-like protein